MKSQSTSRKPVALLRGIVTSFVDGGKQALIEGVVPDNDNSPYLLFAPINLPHAKLILNLRRDEPPVKMHWTDTRKEGLEEGLSVRILVQLDGKEPEHCLKWATEKEWEEKRKEFDSFQTLDNTIFRASKDNQPIKNGTGTLWDLLDHIEAKRLSFEQLDGAKWSRVDKGWKKCEKPNFEYYSRITGRKLPIQTVVGNALDEAATIKK